MKKRLVLFVCLTVCLVGAGGVFAKRDISATTLPPVIAQVCGQANTVVMWHDINDDGKADYKVAYVFKNGRLYQLSRSQIVREEPERQIQER